jgi:enediyne biosynthesis protein E11
LEGVPVDRTRSGAEMTDVFADLVADGDVLDRLVSGLDAAQWNLPTPAPGWTVKHQVAHITSTARIAGAAAAGRADRAVDDFDAALDAALQPYLALPPPELLATWRAEREAAAAALAAVPPGQMLQWLTRPMPAQILASAGVMELFAHGQDIADAVGVRREHTDRIRHVVRFAMGNWDFGYRVRGLTPPAGGFRFEITAPSGDCWRFGPADAAGTITGPAVDFCLLVTRRRHRDDLAVIASSPAADHWLDIAQAYRGSPGPGRSPGQFADPAAA